MSIEPSPFAVPDADTIRSDLFATKSEWIVFAPGYRPKGVQVLSVNLVLPPMGSSIALKLPSAVAIVRSLSDLTANLESLARNSAFILVHHRLLSSLTIANLKTTELHYITDFRKTGRLYTYDDPTLLSKVTQDVAFPTDLIHSSVNSSVLYAILYLMENGAQKIRYHFAEVDATLAFKQYLSKKGRHVIPAATRRSVTPYYPVA